MNSGFLHIIHVPSWHKKTKLSELNDYYKSDALSEAISVLINKGINRHEIQDRKVLLKPNWVRHSMSAEHEFCMRTNDDFVIAVLRVVLDMRPSRILIGDAPIQGCKWDMMISESFITRVRKLSYEYKIPVRIEDFRRRTYDFKDNKVDSKIKPLSDYIIFDLAGESVLEPITITGKNKFRVTNYDPDRMVSAHSPGTHKYCITREFFDADLIISLPKIKTHQKTGITGALKNLVGINGDKDFLPHHRIGGTKRGGDCYPGGSFMRYLSEFLLDYANRNQGRMIFWFWQKLSSLFWILSFPGPEHNMAAGWYGNDTTWRMVMDLNKIAQYGNSNGTISNNIQRHIYSLCDGIIAGQGDGPLNPVPLHLGIISFTNNSFINDQAMALLMGLPIKKLPLINNVFLTVRLDCETTLNGERIELEELKKYLVKAKPPKGWKGYLNNIK